MKLNLRAYTAMLVLLLVVLLLLLIGCTPEEDAALAARIEGQDWEGGGRALAGWCCGGGVVLVFFGLGALTWGAGWLLSRRKRTGQTK